MNVLLLAACAGLIAGCFLLLGLSPAEFSDGLFGGLLRGPRTLRDDINEAAGRKKPSFLRRELLEIQTILTLTGRADKFSMLCAAALALLAAGAGAAILFGNLFLAPVLAVGCLFLPFWYVRLTQAHYKKEIAAELETALSIITTAYLRSEDLITAVKENLQYLNPPVSEVFGDFLGRVQLIDPDIGAALRDLRGKIDNDVYREWVDALAACQTDRGLKTTLTPVVSKLSDMRVVNGELETLLFEPRKEFIIMAALVVGNVPLMYFLNRDWFGVLTQTAPGQIILALCAAAVFVSAAFVVKLTQPIEYRR